MLSSTVVAYLESFRRIDDVAATLGYISGKVMAGFTNRGGQEGIGMNGSPILSFWFKIHCHVVVEMGLQQLEWIYVSFRTQS